MPFTCAITLLFNIFFYLAFIDTSFAEANTDSHILYLNSYTPGYRWSDDIQKGLVDGLELSEKKIDLSVEYLDSRRFAEPLVQAKIADTLFVKYATYRHDLVVVSDNAAFSFAIKYRERLFPDIPIVFCGYNNFRPEVLRGLANITGVNEEMDVNGLIDTALYIQPKIQTLAFIISTGDVSNKLIAEKVAASVGSQYQNHYEIVVLKDAPMSKIRETLARLPSESALFMLGKTSDMGDGRTLSEVESAYLIATTSPVPCYTLWDFHLDTGVLGGQILTGYNQGKAVAAMALQIISGKSASSIPVLLHSPFDKIFDYNVMKRFNIAMEALPSNSIVINKPYSFYEINKKIVWAVLTGFTALTVFAIILSFNINRRKRAEKELKRYGDHLEVLVKERTAELIDSNKALVDSEEKYHSLSDAALEGIVLVDEGRIIETNETFSNLFGYTLSECIGKTATIFIHLDEREKVKNWISFGYGKPYETLGLRKDGSSFPIEIHSKAFSYRGQQVRVTAVRDISEQKRAEEEIKRLRGILPLCSFCKKIRDDKGYWEQVDVYIHKYSEADISHGICPECMKEHYPEEYEDIYKT